MSGALWRCPRRAAGSVVKRFGQSEGSLKAMVRACGSRAQVRELEELEKLSALGKSYLGALRREVRRLMLVADETLDGAVAESVTEKLGERELLELKKAFGARAAKSSARMCRSSIRVRCARRTSATSACEQRTKKRSAFWNK